MSLNDDAGLHCAVASKLEAGDPTPEVVITIDSLKDQVNEGSRLLQNNGNIRNSIGKATLSLHGVAYRVEVPSSRRCCSKRLVKNILQDINGTFKTGINAILGPTGSGKTTLLNVLAGRAGNSRILGKVLLNGQKLPSNFKNIAGYVIQDDIVMSMLSVRENIMFSANLRLSDVTDKERKEKVDEIIDELGLLKCAESRIGTYYQRGVSGGERKRTCIAMELITSSQVLFLDEPTTGLDAGTAHSVIHLLKSLANKGMTIILTIHQPRYSIFKMFDRLFVLSRGECIYHGPSQECLNFFASAGYTCEEHDNPSDFILDVLSGNVQSPPMMASLPQETVEGISYYVEDSESARSAHETLTCLYKDSQWASKVKLDLQNEENLVGVDDGGKVLPAQGLTSFCKQFLTVSKRTWQSTIRNRHALMTQLFSAVILSLIVGSIYFQIDKSAKEAYTKIQNRVGAFFFIIMNYVFGNMSAVDIFIKERAIYLHEVVSGYYCVSAYYLAKLLFDVLPQRFLPITLFAIITFFMIGFHQSVSQFFFYFLNIILISVAGTSVALFFSASTKQHTIGTILTSLVWVVMMVYSGVLVNVETIPQSLQWISFISIFRYGMNGFLVNEMEDMSFCSTVNSTLPTNCLEGNNYLDNQGIPHGEPIHLWTNEICLFFLAAAFLLLTFIQLKRSTRVFA